MTVVTSARPDLLSGNRMTALGALSAGCRFFAGYPITPSSEIYQTMMEELPRRSGLALSAPDEISALTACVGASLAGHRAMTATSAPGWSLMVETVQYAVMTETPVVIAFVQRLGPSTGGATQGAQGDALLAEFSVSGGYTIPVFAPATARECYELTRRAFEWSERLRTPAVLLSDKEVAMTLEAVDLGALDDRAVEPRPTDGPPWYARVGGDRRVVVTGSAHDFEGRLRKNAPEVVEVLTALQAKVAAHAQDMTYVREELDDGADTLVVSYGVSARASLEACRRLRQRGQPVSFLQLQTLFPLPTSALRDALGAASRVVVGEENLTGLYAGVLAPHLGGRELVRVNGVGSMISPTQIEAAVEAA